MKEKIVEIKESKKNTRQLILDAAFSFFLEPRFRDFSINELASRVGITKPAIYRYFSGKDALLLEMEKYYFDSIAVRLRVMQSSFKPIIPFAELIQFFVENPELINYTIFKMTNDGNFERTFAEAMLARGVRDEFGYLSSLHSLKEDFLERVQQLYAGFSILFFIKIREKISKNGNCVGSPEIFGRKLVQFLLGGFFGVCKKGETAFPQKISKARKEEHSKECAIFQGLFPEENAIFKAIASCCEKCGMSSVTLERIADELGMAKSSLYYYFDSKSQMLTSLMERELSLLTEFIRENSVEARNFSEYIWVLFHSEIEFFCLRPSIIPVLGWMIQNVSVTSLSTNSETPQTIWEKRMKMLFESVDLGFPLPPSYLMIWLGSLPAVAIIFGRKHSLSREELFLLIEMIFDFVQNGLEENG